MNALYSLLNQIMVYDSARKECDVDLGKVNETKSRSCILKMLAQERNENLKLRWQRKDEEILKEKCLPETARNFRFEL